MEFTLIAKFFGGLALDLAKPKLGEAVDRRLSPSAIKKALSQAVDEADRQIPRLFASYERDGLKGSDRFLNEAFRGTAIAELKKPLQEQGKPDAALLAKVFLREAEQHPRLKEIEACLVEDWMHAFTEAYFQTTNSFLSFQVTKEQYYQQLRAKTGKVVFSGMAVDGTVVDEPGELARIFVMPDVRRQDAKRYERSADLVSEVPPEIAQDEQKRILWEQQQQLALMKAETSGQKLVSAVELLKKKDEQRIVILGAPGAGKTTLMNYWVVTAASAQIQKTQIQEGASSSESASKSVSSSLPNPVFATADCFPVLIRIRDLAREPDLSVLDFLTKFVKADLEVASVSTGFFQHWLETGEALILLDGLDEVADDAQRHKVVGKIETFLNAYPHCPAIITSRPAGYRDDYFSRRQYPHYELLPFDDDKIETFIDHWYDSRVDLSSERERRKDSLRSALENKPRIKQLARNPLLLTIIALIHRYRTLPRQRHELYNSAVDTLISKWDEDKELTTGDALKYLNIPDIRRLMERLAYWIHTQGSVNDAENGTQIERSTLITKLTKFIKEIKASEKLETYAAKAEAETLLDKIVKDRAGLLAKQGERRYSFVHKTFQEYLCSKEILYLQEDQDPDDDDYKPYAKQHIKEYLHDPHWQEVLLLLVAQQTPNQAKASLKTILKADSEYEQWLHRDVLFAGSCLAENVEVNSRDVVDEILTKLVDIETSPQLQSSNKLHSEVSRTLANLRGTPFASGAMQRLAERQRNIEWRRFVAYQSYLEPDEAILQLLQLLKDDDPVVRDHAAVSLGQLGNTSDAVNKGLLALRQDADEFVRYDAAASLIQLGNVSSMVVEELLSLLQDANADWDVREGAAESLGKIGNDSDTVKRKLLAFVQNADADVRILAVTSLILLENTSDIVVDSLLTLAQDTDADVRFQAATSFEKIGNTSGAVINRLLTLIQDADADVRCAATESLISLGSTCDAIVDGLLALIRGAELDAPACYEVAESLVQLGGTSDIVVNSLIALVQDTSTSMRYPAAFSLIRLGNTSDVLLDSLLTFVQDKDAPGFIRYEGTMYLMQIGNTSGVLLNSLLALAKDADTEAYVRRQATAFLTQLANTSGAMVDHLLTLIKDADTKVDVRYRATTSLMQLGDASDVMVNNLLKLLQDNSFSNVLSRRASDYASESLVKLSNESDTVKPVLIEWLKQHHNETYVGNGIDVLWEITRS